MQDAEELSGLERADAEESVADWLEMRDVVQAWDAAPVLVESGADSGWLDEHLGKIAPEDLSPAVAVLTSAATTAQLTSEIEQASARISALVQSVKTYTNMDGAGLQDVDVRKGLKSTKTMLLHKLKNYQINIDWPKEVPTVPGNPGELNQVWTNLLDNAADALAERAERLGPNAPQGEIMIRISSDDDAVSVSISRAAVRATSARSSSRGLAPQPSTWSARSARGWRVAMSLLGHERGEEAATNPLLFPCGARPVDRPRPLSWRQCRSRGPAAVGRLPRAGRGDANLGSGACGDRCGW